MQNAEMVEKMTSQSLAVGAENLLNVLKNYARVKGHGSAKQLITVGVVGFPNVGKSSVINSLKRSKAAVVGNMPGVTKKMQEISLDKNIVLIDSPGVVLEELTDPVRPVEALLNRVENEQLLKFYRIGQFTTAEQFLAQVAKKKGLLGAGGVPNIDETARCVIRDYLNGKLTYFTTPPQIEDDEGDDDAEMEGGSDEAMEDSDQ
jgi:nuclear GTP-binding protein